MRRLDALFLPVLIGLRMAALAPAQPCDPQWAAIGGPDSHVFALALFDEDGDGPNPPGLMVGGQFTQAGGQTVNHVARWDGQRWQSLGDGVDASVWTLAVFDEDGEGPAPPALFVGGYFTTAGGVPAPGLARWDGRSWTDVGGSVGGDVPAVLAMTVWDDDGAGPNPPALFVGGEFTSAGPISANRIAKWDGRSWSALGEGIDGDFPFVSALAPYDEDGDGPNPTRLMAGGEFTLAGGQPAANVARWDGRNWSQVGGGVNRFLDALTVWDPDGAGPARALLMAGGRFTRAGGQSATGIAQWDGATWSAVGGGVNAPVMTLTAYDIDGAGPLNPLLYAGGIFSMAGGRSAANIAQWDGVGWAPLGSGTDRGVEALLGADLDGSGPGAPTLYVGGTFTRAGGQDSPHLAAWVGCQEQRCSGDVDGDGDTDQADLATLLADYGCTGGDCPGDVDGDGDTDQADLATLLADYGCTT